MFTARSNIRVHLRVALARHAHHLPAVDLLGVDGGARRIAQAVAGHFPIRVAHPKHVRQLIGQQAGHLARLCNHHLRTTMHNRARFAVHPP